MLLQHFLAFWSRSGRFGERKQLRRLQGSRPQRQSPKVAAVSSDTRLYPLVTWSSWLRRTSTTKIGELLQCDLMTLPNIPATLATFNLLWI